MAGSTLTFSRAPLAEALRGVAGLGFTAVELAALEGWAHVAPSRLLDDFPGELERVRQTLSASGLRPVAINGGLGAAEAREVARRARALFRLALGLGVSVVTMPAGPAEAGLDAAADHLRPLVEEATRYGVVLSVETHMGAVTEEPAAAAALCRMLPGLRLTLDPSHYWAGPARGRGWEATLPYVAHVHLRDAGLGGWEEIQVWPGRGAVDFATVDSALRRTGYTGARAVEYIDSLPVTGGRGAAEAAAEMARLAETWGK